MNYRLMSVTSALLSSVLLFVLVPLYTHGSLLAFNVTQSNSTHSASSEGNLEPTLSGKPSSIYLARKPRTAEEPVSIGQGRNRASAISVDTAEQEHQTDVAVGGMGAGLPTMAHSRAHLDFKEEDTEDSAPLWHSKILQPDGSISDPITPSSSHDQSLSLSEPDNDREVIKVNFYDLKSQLETPSPQKPQELQSGDLVLYDYYSNNKADYTITESYTYDDQPTPVDMEDENLRLFTKAVPSKLQPMDPDYGASGANGFSGPSGIVDGISGGCLLGFIRKNGVCQSPCDIYKSYCFNGGQCYVVDGVGAFCRCNMQDYIWNKGKRCESVITEFQVMCIVVGAISVTLLVFFMVIVFFSKRLHLLKIENKKLRKRSRSRPQSQQHNNSLSLSTIAEGSQANKTTSKYTWVYKPTEECCSEDDTSKPAEPVKTPTKEDDSLNIQNSVTPKHENNVTSGEENAQESGVTIDLELLLPKEPQASLETNPPLHYNVFLYKLPKSPKISPGRSRKGKALHQLRPRRGSEPGYSPISGHSLPPMPSRNPNPHLGKARTP